MSRDGNMERDKMTKQKFIIKLIFSIGFGMVIVLCHLLWPEYFPVSTVFFFEIFLAIYLLLTVIWRTQACKKRTYPGSVIDKFFVYSLIISYMIMRYCKNPGTDNLIEMVIVVGIGVVLTIINIHSLMLYEKADPTM